MAQKFVGIDLGSHHLKFAVMTSGFRGVQIVDVFEEPVGSPPAAENSEGVDPLAHRVAVALMVLQSRGLLGLKVGLALPANLLSYRVLHFPFSDERRIAQTVGFEADGQFAVPLHQLMYDHVASAAGDEGRALVAAANRESVERILEQFRRAGVEVKMLTSGALAASQALKLDVPAGAAAGLDSYQSAALVVDIGHRFTHYVAVGSDGPLAVRALRRGGRNVTQALANLYRVDPVSAEASKHSESFLPTMGGTQSEASVAVIREIDPIIRELEQTILWLRGALRVGVQQLVVTGGGSMLDGFVEYLHQQTGLPVTVGSTSVGGAGDVQVSASALAAVGAAFGVAKTPWIRLSPDNGEAEETGFLQERMSSLVAIGIAVVAFGSLDTIARLRAADTELVGYQEQLSKATEDAFGESLTPQQLNARLAEIKGEGVSSLLPAAGALDVLALLTDAVIPVDLEQVEAQKAAEEAAKVLGPDGKPVVPVDDANGAKKRGAPSSPDAVGLMVADGLTFSAIDITPYKVELHAAANASSSMDRLVAKLQAVGCFSNIIKGKIKGSTRRTFQVTLDNQCYQGKPKAAADENE